MRRALAFWRVVKASRRTLMAKQFNHKAWHLSSVSFFLSLFNFNLSWLHVEPYRRISMCIKKKTESLTCALSSPWEFSWSPSYPHWLPLPLCSACPSHSSAKAGGHLDHVPNSSPAASTTIFTITAPLVPEGLGFSHARAAHRHIRPCIRKGKV